MCMRVITLQHWSSRLTRAAPVCGLLASEQVQPQVCFTMDMSLCTAYPLLCTAWPLHLPLQARRKPLATCPADLEVGVAARRLQQVPARHSYQCPGGSCVPGLAALPQQTDADLLRPLVLANDQPYAVAGGSLPVPVPQRATYKAARQAFLHPHQSGRAPLGRYHLSSMLPAHIKQLPQIQLGCLMK